MRWLPFYPFFKLVQLICINKGVSLRGLLHLPTWLVKTILLEPLRWIELLLFERKIHRHQIDKAPVFILGHYRSGTTYLQRLFMQDNRLGYMSIFQSALPEICLGFEKPFTRATIGAIRFCKLKNPFHRIPFTWQFPGEDDVGMTALLSSRGAQWGMLFPKKADDYFKKYVVFENASHKQKANWQKDYLYLLKKISIKNKGKRLVLKSPPNTARISELLGLFPGARFIFIHRDPLEVYASTKRLWNIVIDNYVIGNYDRAAIPSQVISNYDQLMQRYHDQRSMIPANRLLEISYTGLIHEPLSTMQKIYDQLQIGDFETCETPIKTFIAQQKQYTRLDHQLNKKERQLVATKWRRWFEEWNYAVQEPALLKVSGEY